MSYRLTCPYIYVYMHARGVKPRRSCLSCRKRKARCSLMKLGDSSCLLCSFYGRECIFPNNPSAHVNERRRTNLKPRDEKDVMEPAPWNEKPAFSIREARSPMINDQIPRVQHNIITDINDSFEKDKDWMNDPFCLGNVKIFPPGPNDFAKAADIVVPLPDYDTLEESSLHKTLGLQCNRFLSYVGPTGELDSSVLSHCKFNEKGTLCLSSKLSEEWNVSTDPLIKSNELMKRALTGSIKSVNSCDSPSKETESFVVLQERDVEGTFDGNTVNLNPEYVCEMRKLQDRIGNLNTVLMSAFTKYVIRCYPIIHKTTLLDKFNRSVYELTPSILASIFSFGLNWVKYDSSLINTTMPSSELLIGMSYDFLKQEIGYPTLSTVQTGLLLLQQHDTLQGSSRTVSWLLLSQLIGASYELGLHVDCSSWEIPLWEKQLRNRLAWAVFMEDKWWALTAGRPSFIHHNNWNVPELSLESDFCDLLMRDSPERDIETQDWVSTYDSVLLFVEMVKLTRILSEILETIYNTCGLSGLDKTDRSISTRELLAHELELTSVLRVKMSAWYSQLSPRLRMRKTKSGQFCANASLHIGYFVLAMALFKRLVKFLSKTQADEFLDLKAQVYSASLNLLTHTVSFLGGLEVQHLKAFWFGFVTRAFSLIPTFGFLLFTTTEDPQIKMQCLDKIEELRWVIIVNQSAGANFLNKSLHWIHQYYNSLEIEIQSVKQAFRKQDF